MKSLYLAWKYYRSKATGLGWDNEKMTFTADEDWWKEIIEVYYPSYFHFFCCTIDISNIF